MNDDDPNWTTAYAEYEYQLSKGALHDRDAGLFALMGHLLHSFLKSARDWH